MSAFVVTRQTPGGTVTSTHRGIIETDGPWLIVRDDDAEPLLIVPAHVVVSVERAGTQAHGG